MGRPATDKRERLVSAAIVRFHQEGYAKTSLAAVAKEAEIATGNVFYYFKTKSDLAQAVIDEWCDRLAGYLTAFEPLLDSWQRLTGFIDQAKALSQMYVTLGCPLAALVRDLRPENEALKAQVARIYAVQDQWLEAQFQQCGFAPKQAKSHSRFLMAGLQGSILLAYAQADDSWIVDEVERLTSWIQALRIGITGLQP